MSLHSEIRDRFESTSQPFIRTSKCSSAIRHVQESATTLEVFLQVDFGFLNSFLIEIFISRALREYSQPSKQRLDFKLLSLSLCYFSCHEMGFYLLKILLLPYYFPSSSVVSIRRMWSLLVGHINSTHSSQMRKKCPFLLLPLFFNSYASRVEGSQSHSGKQSLL